MKRTSTVIVILLFSATLITGCESELAIQSVSPSDFKSGEARLIDITGTGFEPGMKVWLGEAESPQVVVAGKKRVVAIAPPDLESGSLSVSVGKSLEDRVTLGSALTVTPGLKIIGLRPETIPENTAVTVMVMGQGFGEGAQVSFGVRMANKVERMDSESLAVTVTSLPKGQYDVRVANPDGSSATMYRGLQVLSGAELPVQPMAIKSAEWNIPTDIQEKQGALAGDLNRDGIMDVIVSASPGPSLLIGKPGGGFENITESAGLAQVTRIYAAYLGDFDNDGWPDVLFTGYPVRLFRNLDGKTFTDVSKQVRLGERSGFTAAWGDYNADGLIDLFIGAPNGDDVFLQNMGGYFEEIFPETFEKMTEARLLNNQQATTFSAVFGDYDQDGYPDLFTGIRGQNSKLFHNQAGKSFKEVWLEPAFFGKKELRVYPLDWGADWGDYDNDGDLDLLTVSGPLGLNLYMNHGGERFEDVTSKARIEPGEMALCPMWGDLDNDGHLDFALADNLSGLRVYRNRADGSFEDITGKLGIQGKQNSTMALTWADLNGDGALDLFVVDYFETSLAFVTTPYPGRHWLKVRLEGSEANSMGIDSVVKVKSGDTVWTRNVSGGNGYLSQGPAELHFGLGGASKVDQVSVTWPGGQTQTVEGVAVDTVITVKQPGKRLPVSIPSAEAPPAAPPENKESTEK